jgi:hypothetical protein
MARHGNIPVLHPASFMNTDRDLQREWLRRSLREQLQLLARPGDEALSGLPDGCVKADELAIDFDNSYRAYLANFGDELSKDARAALQEVEVLFDHMSRAVNADLWTDEAVAKSTEWSEVRRQALQALEYFDEAPAE